MGTKRSSDSRSKIVGEVIDDVPAGDGQVPAWALAMKPFEPGPIRRLIRALFSVGTRRTPAWIVPGHDEGQPPPEGAGVPVRPKGPAPTLLSAAELELPSDSD